MYTRLRIFTNAHARTRTHTLKQQTKFRNNKVDCCSLHLQEMIFFLILAYIGAIQATKTNEDGSTDKCPDWCKSSKFFLRY